MSKTYMRKEKGDDTIICVPLVTWAQKRNQGYVFVEAKDGKTAEQQYLEQLAAAKDAPPVEDDGDGVPTMDNTKDEIVAYLVANEIEHDAADKKADLLGLIEPA